jgi:hypothetical protein
MVPPVPNPSSRLVRAVQAEQAELERHRAGLVRSRESLLAELERIESGIAQLDERRALLRRLAPPAAGAATGERGLAPVPDAPPPEGDALRGPAVREAAVRVLLDHPDRPEALHYRDWYELVTAAGHTIAGKDPVAVFLTQLSRSPVVRKTTRAGVYELDRGAVRRLRARAAEVGEQLRELASAAPPAGGAAVVRARRSELTTQLGRLERALEEATALLGTEAGAAAA